MGYTFRSSIILWSLALLVGGVGGVSPDIDHIISFISEERFRVFHNANWVAISLLFIGLLIAFASRYIAKVVLKRS